MSQVMRKPAFCLCENKDSDQLHVNRAGDQGGNHAADRRLCFRYIDSTIPLLPIKSKFQASNHLLLLYSPVCVGHGLKPKGQVFSRHGLIYACHFSQKNFSEAN